MPAAQLQEHRISGDAVAVRSPRLWAWYLTLAVVCAHFALSYVGRQGVTRDLNLQKYAAGQADLPFQYRALPALTMREMVDSRFFLAFAHHAPSVYHDPYLLSYVVISFIAVAGSVIATASTIGRLTGDPVFGRWSSFLVVYMAYFGTILMYGLTYTVPYDLPSLFFFCVGINLIVRTKTWLYYPLFVLAVFTKETACFVAIFFAIWEWFRIVGDARAKLLRILPHVAAQAVIWVTIKMYLFHLYSSNGSEVGNRMFADFLIPNLKALMNPGQWPLLLSVCGFALPLLIAQRRWIGNPAWSWACALVLPLWFCGMMIVGVIVEVRIFTELISIVAPAIALIVYNRLYRSTKDGAGATLQQW